MTKVLKTLDLNLKNIPKSKQRQAKRDVLEFLENEISRNVAKGRSPVEGETFKTLSGAYAKGEKQGKTTPNLQLEGDLLEALEFNDKTGSKITVGYSPNNPEVEKADGHNQHSAKAKKEIWGDGKNARKALPKRRFIPEGGQDFKPVIRKGITRILDGYRDDPEKEKRERDQRRRLLERQTVTSVDEGPEQVQVQVEGSLFSDDNIIDLLTRELMKGPSE